MIVERLEPGEFSLDKEIEKLRQMLSLPITNVEFDSKYEYGKTYMDDKMNWIWIDAKLFINQEMIGTIPYFSSNFGFGYDTSNHSVFAWDKIYAQFQSVIFDKILEQEPLAVTAEAAEPEPQEHLTLNVKDKDGILIKKASCLFIDDQWNVSVYGLNSIKRTKRVTIILTPPPSRTAGG